MAEKPTVTMKDTKQTIMDAYLQELESKNKLKSQEFNPVGIKATETKKKAVKFAEGMQHDLQAKFADMHTTIDTSLRGIQNQLENAKRDLEVVILAKQALTEELDDLYGIQAEAQSLAALVEAQKTLKERFEEAQTMRMAEVDAYVAEKKANIADELTAWNEKAEKVEQEWKYTFDRECRRQKNEFDDSLEAAERTWKQLKDNAEKDMREREDAITKQEQDILRLRGEIEGFDARLEAAREEAKQKAKKSHEFEVRALKQAHEADAKVWVHENQMLKDATVNLSEKNVDLENKLETAFDKFQGVASKALEAQSNAGVVAEVQKAVASATSGKK